MITLEGFEKINTEKKMTADQSNLWSVKILFSFFLALRVTTDRQHDLKIVPFLTIARHA